MDDNESGIDNLIRLEEERRRRAAEQEKRLEATKAEIARLAKLSAVAYETERLDAIKRLKGLGVEMRASILDRLVAAERGVESDDDGKQGRAVDLADPQPWPEPVDGAKLLDAIVAEILRYMVMLEHFARACALWCVHTYLLDCFQISPRLAIKSPTHRCGKTTLLDVISCLVLRPLPAANVSTAAVFRVAEANRPTFLIDEADTFLAGNEELRGILNSGHRKGASVIRTVGEDHEPRQFATYSACAIALIGKLPATLHDRSAVAELKRRLRSEKVERFRLDRTARLDELARKAARWAEDNAMRIQDCDPKMPDELFNRDADNWRPLLAIADVAGGHWPETARKVAVQCCEAAAAESIGATLEGLLGDIRDLFEEKWVLKYPGFDFLEGNLDLDFSSKEMVEMLIKLEGRPWAELGKQRKPLTQNKLATRLGEIKPPIVPGNVGPENARKRGYKLSQFTDAFARYIVAPAIALQEGEDAPNPQEGGLRVHSRPECDEQGTSGIFKVHSHVLGCALWNREKLNNDGLLCTCAVQKGGTGDSARAGDDRAAPQQDQDGLRRVLAEWRGAFGFDRVVSIDEVVGTEHGGLRDALAPVAAMKDTDTGITLTDGVISNVSLARWLKGVNGVSADRYFLQHEGIDSAGKQLWSLREGAEPPLDELGAPCAGVPLVITRHVRRYLYARGFTDDQIDVLTPEQVHERLSRGLSQEAILELKSWYEAEADRLGLGFDMDALDSALRRRLAGEYGVLENALETEFHRVKYLVSHN